MVLPRSLFKPSSASTVGWLNLYFRAFPEPTSIRVFRLKLDHLKPLLSSGGCIIATVPNVTHASVLLELLAGKFIYRDLGLLDRNHLRFFTLETITELFESAGYRLEHLDRNIVDIKYLDLKADLDRFPPTILEFVKSLPEATTYQYIMKAVTRK